jgi:hypothetical protein
MSVASIPVPRFRLTRIIPAALVAVGLAVGSVAAVNAVDNGNSDTKAPAISAVHAHGLIQSANAAEYRAASQTRPSTGWSAARGLPASPAASEFPDDASDNNTTVRFGPQ